MFDNIGGKIKNLAMVVAWVGIIGFVVAGISMMALDAAVVGLFVAGFGALFSWVGSFALYGFGELIENSKVIAYNLEKMNTHKSPNAKSVKQVKSMPTNGSKQTNTATGQRVSEIEESSETEETWTCEKCGLVQPVSWDVCWECGAEKPKA